MECRLAGRGNARARLGRPDLDRQRDGTVAQPVADLDAGDSGVRPDRRDPPRSHYRQERHHHPAMKGGAMKVAELMRTTITTVTPDTLLGDAVTTLADSHISGLPVIDSRERLIGVLSTTDVLEAEA